MIKLRYLITETRYFITEFLDKIIDPFRFFSIPSEKYQLSHRVKVIMYTIFILLSSLVLFAIAGDIYSSISDYNLDEALCSATYHNNIYQVKLLLKEGADPNDMACKFDMSSLQWATKNGHKDMVKLLIKYGAKH